jgi:hypothetical protein
MEGQGGGKAQGVADPPPQKKWVLILKKPPFFAVNCQKWQKFVIITSTPSIE